MNGEMKMEYRIKKMNAFRIVGVVVHTTIENGDGMQAIPAMWNDVLKEGKNLEIARLADQHPHGLLGVSVYNTDLQDARKFDYYIASASGRPVPEGMVEVNVPAATWAIFPHIKREAATIQVFQKRILMEWLPTSGFEFAKAPDVERYDAEGGIGTWIPVIRAKPK